MADGKPKAANRAANWLTGLFLLLVAAVGGTILMGPYKDFRESDERLVQLRADEKLALDTLAVERANLATRDEIMQRLRARTPGFEIYAFMSRTLRDAKLAERSELKSMTPNTRLIENAANLSMVELRLDGVTLTDFVNLLHKIYESNNLIVLHELTYARPAQSGKGLDCKMTLITPKG